MVRSFYYIRSLPALALVLGGAIAASHAEIVPMTRQRLTEAEEFGRKAVIVSADPAALFPMGLPPAPPVSVKKVVVRRGEQVIEALRADTHEVQLPELDEKHRRYRGGAFYFPLEPFASEKGDLEIVIVPEIDKPGSEAVLRLKKVDLAKLR